MTVRFLTAIRSLAHLHEQARQQRVTARKYVLADEEHDEAGLPLQKSGVATHSRRQSMRHKLHQAGCWPERQRSWVHRSLPVVSAIFYSTPTKTCGLGVWHKHAKSGLKQFGVDLRWPQLWISGRKRRRRNESTRIVTLPEEGASETSAELVPMHASSMSIEYVSDVSCVEFGQQIARHSVTVCGDASRSGTWFFRSLQVTVSIYPM